MPKALKKPCAHKGCPELTHDRYCEAHTKHYNNLYNKKRRADPKRNDAFYSSRNWRKSREAQLRRHPTCEECLKAGQVVPAKVVDHITPIKQGGDRYDPDNLQSLCVSHHNQKSVEEGSRFGKGNKNA